MNETEKLTLVIILLTSHTWYSYLVINSKFLCCASSLRTKFFQSSILQKTAHHWHALHTYWLKISNNKHILYSKNGFHHLCLSKTTYPLRSKLVKYVYVRRLVLWRFLPRILNVLSATRHHQNTSQIYNTLKYYLWTRNIILNYCCWFDFFFIESIILYVVCAVRLVWMSWK